MQRTWEVPATAVDRKDNGGSIDGGLSFDEAAGQGGGYIDVMGAGSGDTLTVPGLGSVGVADTRIVGGMRWTVSKAGFESMRDGCTGGSGACAGEVICSNGSTLYINDVNHYAAV